MKKRNVILITSLCALALFAGCGKDNAENTNNNGNADNNNTNVEAEAEADAGAYEMDYKASEYVTLGEYMGMELSVEKAEVTEEDVKAYVESILEYYPAYENMDKTVVENGDIVNIDYEGLLDGVAFAGGTAQDQILEIGSGTFIDGFEEGLIGVNVGESVSLDLSFPDPYNPNPDLAGKAVVFNVTVNAIVQQVEVTYENVTDEYVVENLSMMGFDSVESLKKMAEDDLNSTNDYYAQSDARAMVIEKLAEVSTVNELPEGLLDARVNNYIASFTEMCEAQYGMSLTETLEQYYQQTEEEFKAETVEYMQENLELELILQAVAEQENIELDEEGYQQFISSLVSQYGYSEEEEVYADYGEAYVKSAYLSNKAVSLLLENANITYVQPKTEE